MSGNVLAEARFSKPSLRMRLMEKMIGARGSDFNDPQKLQEEVPKRARPVDAPMPDNFNRRFIVETWRAPTDKGSTKKRNTEKGSVNQGGYEVVTLHPKSGKGAKHIIYFHGGGFYLPMFKEHWPLVAALVEATGASLSVPLYPVVPEHNYAPTYAQADAVYEAIAAEWGDANIALCGDSAGGNLAIATALRRRDAGKSLPGQIIPFAPWLDMGMRDEDALAVEPDDVMLGVESLKIMGQWWADDRPVDDPIASPLYADLSGLPPISIFQGCHDVFVIDSRTFASRAKDAGVPIKLYEYAGGPHVYMALTFTREAKDTFALMADILKD